MARKPRDTAKAKDFRSTPLFRRTPIPARGGIRGILEQLDAESEGSTEPDAAQPEHPDCASTICKLAPAFVARLMAAQSSRGTCSNLAFAIGYWPVGIPTSPNTMLQTVLWNV